MSPSNSSSGSALDKPRRILLLTADAGFGHRSAANAVDEALTQLYGDKVVTTIINPLEDKRAPAFLRESQYDYDRWVKEVPELYRLGYSASDTAIPTHILENALTVLLFEVMRKLIAAYRPQVILTTYPMYQSVVSNLMRMRRCRVPLYTVVTDLATVHRLWFHKHVDGLLVPNQVVASLAEKDGIPPEKITITGIPVHPGISQEKRSKEELRRSLGWDPHLTTILGVGSKRVEGLTDALNVINHFGIPLQTAVVAGKDRELFTELQALDWHIPTHLYEYSSEMPALMKASDLILCKAGGLIVTESLASGLPMLLLNVIPGQESGNADYVISHNAAVEVENPMRMLTTLYHLMQNDRALLKQMSKNAAQLGQPESALRVAEILWNAAGKGNLVNERRLKLHFPVLGENGELREVEDHDEPCP
jgi:1,2-diacylglycerol 3-beta-galactosyltransferase